MGVVPDSLGRDVSSGSTRNATLITVVPGGKDIGRMAVVSVCEFAQARI
jgi:hypothetical protein